MTIPSPFPWTAITQLRSSIRGQVLTPESDHYDTARTIWNGMIQTRPGLIVRCTGPADVMAAVDFARDHGARIAVKGGGHNVAGLALCEGGLVIDLSQMQGIRVDPQARTVRAQGGVTWAALDRETLAFGLATTGGMVSSTGIAGLTLGGGLGWQMARHGLACDNLLSADVVTADGRVVTASPEGDHDLFWALRGGGGNFGVVASFEYRLHEMAAFVGGMVLYPLAQAPGVLRGYRDYAAHAPDDLTANLALMTTPDGQDVVAVIAAWFGPTAEAERQLGPLRRLGTPLADLIGTMSYGQLQTMLDPAAPAGLRRYWKSGYVPALGDDFIDVILDHVGRKTSPLSLVLLLHMHGAAARVAPEATAFGARAVQWDLDILPQWHVADEDARHIDWARRCWGDVSKFTSGVYSNHLDTDDGAPRVRAAYGTNYDRLVTLKQRYDTDNLFNVNHNIPPTAERVVPRASTER
jgi:FAD/FMN-containing dehydrogenase